MGFGLASYRGLSYEQVAMTLTYWVVVDELSADLPRRCAVELIESIR